MLYFYPKFSPIDLVIVRSPGAGLANLLFTWARTEVYAAQTGGYAIAPTWRNIKFGTLLRAERDKRFYSDLFVHRTPSRALGDAWLRLSLRERLTEPEFLAGARTDRPALVIVDDIRDGFVQLAGHEAFLMSRLLNIAKAHPAPQRPFLAAHIRWGDFGAPSPTYARNSRIEIEWYVGEVERISRLGNHDRVVVFTDDHTGEVRRAFDGRGGIEFAPPATALNDIMLMSQADHVIVSNSTFSLWAAFLGRGTVSTKFGELFVDYGLTSTDFTRRLR